MLHRAGKKRFGWARADISLVATVPLVFIVGQPAHAAYFSRGFGTGCTLIRNCSIFSNQIELAGNFWKLFERLELYLFGSSHEFGHAFYRTDNPPVAANESIMRENRNRNSSTMRGPKQYDIDEANKYL